VVPLVLAPLAGIGKLPFRILCRECGAARVYTEMTSSEGLARADKEIISHMLATSEKERPVAVQLFGGDPKSIERAAAIIQRTGRFDEINLNMGCPALPVVRSGAGGALMKESENSRFKSVLIALRAGAGESLRVSLKLRLGWKWEEDGLIRIAKLAEENRIDSLILHARYLGESYQAPAKWPEIARLVSLTSLPVIGNGDVRSMEDADSLAAQSGCNEVMIGRVARTNPLVFSGNVTPSPKEKTRLLFRVMELAEEANLASLALAKTHAVSFVHGLSGARTARDLITRSKNTEEITQAFTLVCDEGR